MIRVCHSFFESIEGGQFTLDLVPNAEVARRWPGQEVQVDFGYAGLKWNPHTGRQRKTWMFVMTLSRSRHQYVEFVFDQKIPTWLSCHEHAFQFFGEIVECVVLDHWKTAVLKADLQDHVLGEPYRRLAQHFGFLICPNRSRTPRYKGKVESGGRGEQRGLSDLIRLTTDKVVVEMSPPFKAVKLLKRLEDAQIVKATNGPGQAHH